MSINKTKRILSFLVSSILVSGNVRAMDSKTKFRSKSAPKSSLVQYTLIGGGAVATAGAVTTGVVLYNKKNNTKGTDSPSPTYVPSKSVSHSPSSNYFINYRPTNSTLNKNVENKCLYKIELCKNVFFSVYKGCITTVRPDEYKTGDKIAIMTPDNEGLSPKGYLAQAIALDLFGKDDYPDQQKLLTICSTWPANKGKSNKFVLPTGSAILGEGKGDLQIIHVVGPRNNSNKDVTPEIKNLLKGAYIKGIIMALSPSNNNVSPCQHVLVCLISDGSYAVPTEVSIRCLCDALTELKEQLANSFETAISLNIVIHPDYDTLKKGSPDTKTDLVIQMLKDTFPDKPNLLENGGKIIESQTGSNKLKIPKSPVVNKNGESLKMLKDIITTEKKNKN